VMSRSQPSATWPAANGPKPVELEGCERILETRLAISATFGETDFHSYPSLQHSEKREVTRNDFLNSLEISHSGILFQSYGHHNTLRNSYQLGACSDKKGITVLYNCMYMYTCTGTVRAVNSCSAVSALHIS
jgi:hypothetical protein